MKKLVITFAIILTSMAMKAQDVANFGKYENANLQVMGSKKPVDAVFMGDSITEFWMANDPDFFTKNNFTNRGISGQTSSQMLLRFRNDVINLKPKTVYILAGANDIAENMGPISLENIFGNIVSMAELAKFHHIKTVLLSVLPAKEFPWRKGLQPAPKVIRLNEMLKKYAVENHLRFVDFHSQMKDAENGLPEKFAKDGVHPNLAGYRLMEEILMKNQR